jgi:RNA polymerase sigma factor (sigma-70 family)
MDNDMPLRAIFSQHYDEIHFVVKRTIRKYFGRFCFDDSYEDLVQESMTAVLAALADGRLRDQGNLLTFTASVAFFTGCKVVPKEKRRPDQLDEFYHCPDQGKSPEEILLEKEGRDHIKQGITALTNALDREILRRWFEGEKLDEMRVSMQLSPGQFRNRKSRALKNLLTNVRDLQSPHWKATKRREPSALLAISQNLG